MTPMARMETRWTPRGAVARPRLEHRPVGRRGFTMIEITVVVGILLVLIGIAAIAYKSIGNPVSARATQVALQNLQAQLAEYEAAAGLRNQPPEIWRNGAEVKNTPKVSPPVNIWVEEAVMPILPGGDPAQSGNVTPGSAARYSWDAIGNTQRAYEILAKIPANKQAVTRLPSRQVHGRADEVPTNSKVLLHGPRTAAGGSSGDAQQIAPPLILDAWGNPIIFVGSRGLIGVYVGKKPGTDGSKGEDYDPPRAQRVTSAGTFDVKGAAGIPAGVRPFFASAGPDGNFRTGDDNVYSFQQ